MDVQLLLWDNILDIKRSPSHPHSFMHICTHILHGHSHTNTHTQIHLFTHIYSHRDMDIHINTHMDTHTHTLWAVNPVTEHHCCLGLPVVEPDWQQASGQHRGHRQLHEPSQGWDFLSSDPGLLKSLMGCFMSSPSSTPALGACESLVHLAGRI